MSHSSARGTDGTYSERSTLGGSHIGARHSTRVPPAGPYAERPEAPRALAGRLALSAFFALAGMLHFARPSTYERIVPPYLPFRRALVLISGAAEIAGGVGALAPPAPLRRASGWGLIALLTAVFPANVHMALHPEEVPGEAARVPRWLLWLRLPLQPLLMAWVYRTLLHRRGR